MDRDFLLLSAALCALSLGVLALGADLFASSRRKAAMAALPQDDLRAFLRIAPPMPTQPTPSGQEETANAKPPVPEEFIFRRNVSRDFASMEISHKRFRPAVPEEPSLPAPMDFSSIQREIRAKLNASPPAVPHHTPPAAQLLWTEAGRLAVLTLAGSAPASGLALLKQHGIGTLLAIPGHPFHATGEDIEILSLPESSGAAASLATRLRARLAQGGRIAFHTETGLSGTAALLAARLSTRKAGLP